MNLRDRIEITCRWYRDKKLARIASGRAYEPSFSGRLMDDPVGAGTRIAFDAISADTDMLLYDKDALAIPYLLTRVQSFGGLAFVLFYDGRDVRLCADVKRLVLRRPTAVADLPIVPFYVAIVNGKPETMVNFLPSAIHYCKTTRE